MSKWLDYVLNQFSRIGPFFFVCLFGWLVGWFWFFDRWFDVILPLASDLFIYQIDLLPKQPRRSSLFRSHCLRGRCGSSRLRPTPRPMN